MAPKVVQEELQEGGRWGGVERKDLGRANLAWVEEVRAKVVVRQVGLGEVKQVAREACGVGGPDKTEMVVVVAAAHTPHAALPLRRMFEGRHRKLCRSVKE